MNDENTKVKNSSVYNAIEILLGLAVLTSVMLDLFDFRLFIAIFGAFGLTFMLFRNSYCLPWGFSGWEVLSCVDFQV